MKNLFISIKSVNNSSVCFKILVNNKVHILHFDNLLQFERKIK